MNKDRLKKILHISPTDIRVDSRILKELQAVESIPHIQLHAFGVKYLEGQTYKTNAPSYIRLFDLLANKLVFLPRPLRYFFNLVEAFIRITPRAIYLKPDLIHCHDTMYLPIAVFVKIMTGSKLIYDAHELESDKAGQSKILSDMTLFIERISWKQVDVFISVSPAIISWYMEKFGNKESLLVLNSPVLEKDKQSRQFEKSNYLREKFAIPQEQKIYIYLGILSKVGRSIDQYLEVFQLNDVNDHIVFIGYGDYVSEIQSIADLNSNIHFHPAVSHDEVVSISSSADVGLCLIESVSLSDYYCLPNKLFEYAFSGLYVLASDFPEIKKVVLDYNLGKCCALNSDGLYKAIKAIEDVDLVGREKPDLYKLSWEYQAIQLTESYNKLLTNK